MRNKYYQIEWGKQFKTTKTMIDRMQNPRRPRSISTIKQYCHSVRLFTKYFLQLDDPDKAFKKVEEDKFNVVDKYIDYLIKEREQAPKTVRVMFHGLKFWLESNELDTDRLDDVELPKATRVLTEDRKPTKEELREILNFAHIRDKAVAELSISSGLRIGTIASLKWKDVDLKKRKITVKPRMGRKASRKYFTFITPEAKKILLQYREWRERKGEKIVSKSPLIASIHGVGQEKTFPEDLENITPFGEHITSQTLTAAWNRLLDQAGFTEKSHLWHTLHFHTLRKYFKTQCVNAGVRRPYLEFWMGHKGAYLDNSYFRANLKEHIREYEKAVPLLTVYRVGVQEKKLRVKAMIDFAKLQGYNEEKMRKLRDVLARAKDLDEGIREFRRFQQQEQLLGVTNNNHEVVTGEKQLLEKLEAGWKLVQPLNGDKYLIQQR